MDTKEKKPVRKRTAAKRTAAKRPAAPLKRRTRPTAQRPRKERVIRPPRENIPDVVYTMPQPLRRATLLLRLVSVVLVVAALMGAVSIFFRVDTITVVGAKKYSAWSVREASGITEGDSLLGLSKARAAGKIRSTLPYVDEVKITRTLPGTVNIAITELDVTYAVSATDNSWWLITSDGLVVEKVDASTASGYTRVFGVSVEAPRVGQTVVAAADAPLSEETEESSQPTESGMTLPTIPTQTNSMRLAAALTILRALEENEVIGQVSRVDVESLLDITLQYGQRFKVLLGSEADLAYKVGYMTQAISQMEDYLVGTLDVSFEYSQQGIFTPEG